MKRFIISSLLVLLCRLNGLACGPMDPVHNYYIFSVFNPEYYSAGFEDRLYDFWKRYTGEKRTEAELRATGQDIWDYGDLFFGNGCRYIFQAAHRKHDKLMEHYIGMLVSYDHANSIVEDSWDYPTKDELANRSKVLRKIAEKAKEKVNTRLAPQFCLLYMRANLQLERYQENYDFWNQRARKLPPSVFRDYCENLYANAQLHLGWAKDEEKLVRKACDIYARQGDELSLMWLLRNYRNAAGIRKIYSQDPNSPSLVYLIQQFVNGAQETVDQNGSREEIEWVGLPPTYEPDIDRFLTFSRQVVTEGRTRVPCLWLSAAAMLRYLKGDYRQAMADADRAVLANGSERMHDNARCIRLLVSTKCNSLTPEYTRYLRKEFEWLDSKTQECRPSPDWENYYAFVKDRVASMNLIPKYRAEGRKEVALLLKGAIEPDWGYAFDRFNDDEPRHSAYSEYVASLDSLTADEMAGYARYLQSQPADEFERYLISQNYRGRLYFTDYIGTKYLAEGRFAEALRYLKRVPMLYVNGYNDAYPRCSFDFTQPRWLVHQVDNDEGGYGEDYQLPVLAGNYRVDFCRDMLQLQSRYRLAGTDTLRRDLAYELAKRYYQASVYGDCWYISRYEVSWTDSARSWQMDFAQTAVNYLDICLHYANGDFRMTEECLYAKAYILYNVATSGHWYWINWLTSEEVVRAYDELAAFYRQNRGRVDLYVTRCDVLRDYMDGNP